VSHKTENDKAEINNAIKARNVLLVTDDGNKVVPTFVALQQAENAGLDLVRVGGKDFQPVCKILDYGKMMYQKQKAEKEAAKKQRENRVLVKEIQLRPNTDVNDLNIKARKAKEFLAEGNKVKVVMRFRGREAAFKEIGISSMAKFLSKFSEFEVSEASDTGRDITAFIG
jgi:translation initiation factor IF-3